jgi:hypothetical protein
MPGESRRRSARLPGGPVFADAKQSVRQHRGGIPGPDATTAWYWGCTTSQRSSEAHLPVRRMRATPLV